MDTDRLVYATLALTAVTVSVLILLQAGVLSAPWADERSSNDETSPDVQILDEDGEPKAGIEVEVADTPAQRYTGLSDHESLPEGEGMLFVHPDEDERTYVMREMAFDIDIIFIDADREITAIEHARAPEPHEDGEDLQYTGQAQYVLEVPRGYANQTEMASGDTVEIDLE